MAMLNNQIVNKNKRPQQQEKWWATLTYQKQTPTCGSVSKPCTPGEHQNSW